MNSRLFTFMIFDRLDVSGQVMRVGIKSFLGFTVHSVHLWFFINNFIMIQGEYTVKGEQ
ncbi:hypothetical protein YC70_002626 [Salmonella enterica subsp. enterica]|nr:hypothetical protein [Salmonella enterica subsp. enterica serovar Javiana]EDW5179109.1 hypothetical protein [Salmonella enterica subsp. enterica serovar Anatum]